MNFPKTVNQAFEENQKDMLEHIHNLYTMKEGTWWQIRGITVECLKQLHESDYKKGKSGGGVPVMRLHCHNREEIKQRAIDEYENLEDQLSFYHDHNFTILGTAKENSLLEEDLLKTDIIWFDEEVVESDLFVNNFQGTKWRKGKEIPFLKELYNKYFA